MSRSRRILAGLGVSIVNQALVAVVGLGVTRFTLHRIGARDYGLWLIGAQFLAYLSLLDLGVTALLPRDVARVTGEHTEGETRDAALREVIGRSISVVLLLVVLLVIASAAMLVLLPSDWGALRGPLALSLAAFVATYPFRLAHSALTGLQELAYVGAVQTASWALGVATTVASVLLGLGLYSVAAGPAVAQIASSAAWSWRLARRHSGALPRKIRWVDLAAMRTHAGPGGWVSLSQVAQLLLNSTDVVIIGRMLGPAAVLPYTFTDKSETLLNNQPYTIASLTAPALSELRASRNFSRLARAVGAVSGLVVVLSGAIAIAILATNHAFVRLWIGEENFGGMSLTALLLANMLARHWTFTFSVALFACGREREMAILAVIDGLISVGLSLFLVPRLGIIGVPIASLAALMLTQTPGGLVLVARETKSTLYEIATGALPWFFRFLPLAAGAWFIGDRLGSKSLVEVAMATVGILAAYGILMLPLLRKPPLDVYAAPYLAKISGLRKRIFQRAP